MVNTRRKDSLGSPPVYETRHQTRRSVVVEDPGASSSLSASGSDESACEEDASGPSRAVIQKNSTRDKPRVRRELRGRFVYNRFSSRISTRGENSRNLNERRGIRLYTARKMDEETDSTNSNYEDHQHLYGRSSRRVRHLEMRSRWSRVDRRTALSLRPIRQKCYVDDDHSPVPYNSDSEGNRGVRRSKRKVQFKRSWIEDEQVHKVGYPTLNSTAYSEEDSRDAQPDQRNEIEQVRRTTRHSSSMNETNPNANSKYLYDFDDSRRSRRPKTAALSERRNSRELRSRLSNEKDNKDDASLSSRLRIDKVPKDVKIETAEADDSNEPFCENGDAKENEINQVEVKKKENEDSSSSEAQVELPRLRTRTRSGRTVLTRRFPSRETRQHKELLSSDSEREGRDRIPIPQSRKGYSLRNRPPKPPPTSTHHSHDLTERRRRFTRIRRRTVSNSSSSSSSSSDRKRYSKNPKSPHSKNEQRMKSGAGGSKIIPIGPETLDKTVKFNTVGGLDSHIQCLKEMILLPMMYPEVFRQFQVQPPRGVLFHGPPGTGKTLIARALANECSFGQRKVSFFMRKGADLLSKWIGESEKQLKLLFEQASEMKPSIIFFDELDGLAPVRSSRQDQVHASIVSTLLALMDGLDNRGEVIVIGATNRIDSIDPALRRPGRFDRELFFPLPARKEREEILNVHISQWKKPPTPQLVSYLAEQAVGYCGSDLRALCSEAVIQSFRRTYPQVYDSEYRLLLDPENVNVQKLDFLRAKSMLVPASHRISQCVGKKMLPILEPLLDHNLSDIFTLLATIFPHGVNESLAKVKLSANIRPAQVLLVGDGADHGQTLHLAPAILYKMEHVQCYILDLITLYKESSRSTEEAIVQVFTEARRNVPSVIHIPSIDKWWKLVNETTRAILLSQLTQLDPHMPILILATSDTAYKRLPQQVQNLFSRYRKEVYELKTSTAEKRRGFFKPLLDACIKPIRLPRRRLKTPSPLPRAPTPPPAPLSEADLKKAHEHEERTLRELRIFLRDMCRKLAQNKLFYIFTKPVDTEEVPDYPNIITQPMDLETMMTKVDFHRYECAKDFLRDIDLICKNALEYNPAKNSVDRQIRHRACSLRDYAYALIKAEMDSDFEDKCQNIATTRVQRTTKLNTDLPDYIVTPDNMLPDVAVNDDATTTANNEDVQDKSENRVSSARKRKMSSWQRGMVKTNKKKKKTSLTDKHNGVQEKGSSDDESKENNPNLESSYEDVSSHLRKRHSASNPSLNCDTPSLKINVPSNSSGSPRRRLSDIMSPSELLNDALDFDDVDQALNETMEDFSEPQVPIQCSPKELDAFLDKAVKLTNGYTLQSLLDLYNQLNRIIRKYLKTHARDNLPSDLCEELVRFKKEQHAENLSDSSHSSVNSNAH